jgi:hypothetical protein
MFLRNTKRKYNEEVNNYSNLLTRIQNLLIKDEEDTTPYVVHNSSFDFLDKLNKRAEFPRRPVFTIPSVRIRTSESRLKSEIITLEEELAILNGSYNNSLYEDSLLGGLDSVYGYFKSIFSKGAGSKSLSKKELRERVKELRAERREALQQLYRKVSKQKNHLQKSRSLYSILVDLREDLRRVVRKVMNTSLDDEEDAYLISKNVFAHEQIRLNKNFLKNLIDENKNYKCYSARTQ